MNIFTNESQNMFAHQKSVQVYFSTESHFIKKKITTENNYIFSHSCQLVLVLFCFFTNENQFIQFFFFSSLKVG